MNEKMLNRIVKDFDDSSRMYNEAAEQICSLIEKMIRQNGVTFHSINFRCKTRESLQRKLARPGKSYQTLSEVTDLAGIRITTFFSDDVDKVCRLVESEFDIDGENSVDKRISEDPNRFGYQSMHYVAQLNVIRRNLMEYKRFGGVKFEIQIRSILQHAWAEIEHDLGYKSEIEVPSIIRRRFARISGLLELADNEFNSIREAQSEHIRILPSQIDTDPFSVTLDSNSLQALYRVPSHVSTLDQLLRLNDVEMRSEEFHLEVIMTFLRYLTYFEIYTVGKLEDAAKHEVHLVGEFAKYWMEDKSLGIFYPGIGLFYLCYVLAWRTNNKEKIVGYVHTAFQIVDDNTVEGIVEKIMKFVPSGKIKI